MGNRYLYAGLAGFVTGIFFRSFFDFGLAFTSFVAVIAVTVFILGRIEEFHQGKTLESGEGSTFGSQSVLAMFIFAAALGMFRYDLLEFHKYNPLLEQNLGREAALRGVVSDELDERESSSRLTVALDTIV